MIMRISAALLFLLSCALLRASSSMVGDCAMREAVVWVKTMNLPSQSIVSTCFKPSSPEAKIYGRLTSVSADEYTAKIVFSKLSPNTRYDYHITDGVETLKGSFVTKPDHEGRTPPPDFAFAVLGGNCVNDKEFDLPFQTPGGDYEIYDTVLTAKPSFVIWADGANRLRNADADSRGAIFARFAQAREFPPAKKLLASQANYGVAARSNFAGKDSSSALAADSADAFDKFWANPSYVSADFKAYSFKYSDAEFFVLDDISRRSNLDYQKDRPYFLGEAQLRWLLSALQNSTAKFKIIVSNAPVVNPVKSPENFTFAASEREAILNFLLSQKISGVVFISGNNDFGEISRLVRAGGYPLFEIGVPPLTDRPADVARDLNYFRVPSSTVNKRGFAVIKIDGSENARAITFSFRDAKGNVLFSSTVKESELKTFD